jgi:DinB superfamily
MTQPEPDDKDWTWVLEQPCPECGYDASTVADTDVAGLLVEPVDQLAAAVRADGSTLRPNPREWSALEYGCHVRDVCRLFGRRTSLMLTEDDPVFENWDQDATAVQDKYWEQLPAEVAVQLEEAAADVAAIFAAVPGDAWQRPGRRSNGSTFTVDSLARYFLHDLVHHAHDVARPSTARRSAL